MIRLILTIIIIMCLGAAGAFFTAPNIDGWYKLLQKPPLTPPNALFGPMWTLLYFMMAIAYYRLSQAKAQSAKKWFIIQFVLNLAWAPVFFGLHSISGGMAVILLLDAALAITIIKAYKADKPAGFLLTVYFAWLCFATYLNAGIYWLN